VHAEHQSAACAVVFEKESDREVALQILFDESKDQFRRELEMRGLEDSRRDETIAKVVESSLWSSCSRPTERM